MAGLQNNDVNIPHKCIIAVFHLESLRPTKRYLILLTTSLGAFLAPFTSSALSFAVPEIGYALKANFYQIIWVPQSFLIALASVILLMGRLSDSVGRVRVYRYGFVFFILGIILAAFSLNIFILSASLFIAGIGAAILGANSTAIISQVFEDRGRGRALGINVMSVYLGLTLAPVLSGLLIMIAGWRSILYFTLPVSITGLIISLITLKGLETVKKEEKLDLVGGMLFATFIFSIVIFLTVGEIYGWSQAISIALIAIILLISFFLRERAVANPLMDMKLLTHNRTFLASNMTAFFNYMSTFSIVFVFSIYLQVIDHYSSGLSGILLISEPIFMVIFSPVSGILSDKYGSREIAAIGMGLIGLTFIFLYFITIKSIIEIVVPLSVIGIGFGLFSAANTSSVMGSVNNKQYGTASGTLGTMRFTGQLISVAIAGTILSTSISKKVILGIFNGIEPISEISLGKDFQAAFRIIMLISGIISLIGVYTSLMKDKRK